MSLITPDAMTPHLNYLQFMQHCISEGLNYDEYTQSAVACNRYVDTQANYQNQTANMLAEATYWNNMADECVESNPCNEDVQA